MPYKKSFIANVVIVTLAEAKTNLRITHDLQNDMIQGMVDTAVTMISNYTGREVHNYEITATFNAFIDKLVLKETPVLGNFDIKYRDEANEEATLDPATYVVEEGDKGETVLSFLDAGILPKVFDREDAVTISYEIGYSAATVPAPFKTFVLQMVNKLYDNPADSALKYRSFAHSLLFPYKDHGCG